MPFTASHVAAVLPLLRTPLPASALVIGSVSPDLPYYLPGARGWSTHSLVAVVTVDVALGLSAWVLWHAVLGPAVVHLAPRWVRARLAGRTDVGLTPARRTGRHLLLVVAALVVGAATHVGWDAFTHAGRWGVMHVPALQQVWGGLEGHRWAQYGGGLLGAGVVAGWIWRWRRRTPVAPVPERPRSPLVWVVLFGAAAVVGVVAASAAPGLRAAAFTGATSGGATLLIGLVVTALVLAVGRTVRTDR